MSFAAQLAAELPSIELLLPNSEHFESRRSNYSLNSRVQPAVIAIPKDATEVAALVGFAAQHSVEFTVRAGGHDIFSRQLVEGGLVIDIRELNHVSVEKAAGKAVIGGGILFEKLIEVLDQHGCVTPTGNIETQAVGYTGWATTGGYGQMAAKYGLGMDHLLSAKIVNAAGLIVEADDDTIRDIRGACGNFGVVVEATIKIYPFNKILAGNIIFESTDYANTIQKVHQGIEAMKAAGDLPDEIDVQPAYANSPFGLVFGVVFCWASPDIERGQKYLEKILSLAPVLMNQVVSCNVPGLFAAAAALAVSHAYVSARSINVRTVSQSLLDVIKRQCGLMPAALGCLVTWHELRASSPSIQEEKSLPSIFGAREPHYILEIIACAVEKEDLKAVTVWRKNFMNEVLEKAPEEVLECQWLPMTPGGELRGLEKLFGNENARFLKTLKRKKDPHNVFKHALPSLVP
ncbi:hypothetical protein BDZ85DRAFT_285083 [Elsinoe ampelina]|uniref:FAD-binding PCMH-type domain-containing protein n=1 Tax=Elsinoe ampelina TaxID=302913 RepID=A0A6A6G1Q6_9PEZI|nr:hypothetical protein BDZ85DRAFT_285083 [Elsinoe ampelina]